MATTAMTAKLGSALDVDRHNALGLVLSAALPLAVFVIVNGVAELNGLLPLFFSPFGLAGWVGGAMHLGALPLFGISRWIVANRGHEGRSAGWWLVALMAGVIAFPFVVNPLDSLALSIVSITLLLFGLATAMRTAKVSRHAGLNHAAGPCLDGVQRLYRTKLRCRLDATLRRHQFEPVELGYLDVRSCRQRFSAPCQGKEDLP